ncbi:MAG: hypothetical protein Q9226_008605 [Calogaya cf. arnoldii]
MADQLSKTSGRARVKRMREAFRAELEGDEEGEAEEDEEDEDEERVLEDGEAEKNMIFAINYREEKLDAIIDAYYEEEDDDISSSSIARWLEYRPRCCTVLPVAILRVNNQVYGECIRVLYRQNTFRFCSSAWDAQDFLAALPEHHRNAIHHIEFPPTTTILNHGDNTQGWHPLPGFISKQMQVNTVTLWIPKDEHEAESFPFYWHSAWALVKLLLAGRIARLRIYIPAKLEEVGIIECNATKPFFDTGVADDTPRMSRVHMDLEDIYAINKICLPENQNRYNDAVRQLVRLDSHLSAPTALGGLSEEFIKAGTDFLVAWNQKKVAMKREDATEDDDKTVIVLTKPTRIDA